MADDDKDQRTEKPTRKRLREARHQGQVARTPEISGWLVVLVGTELLPVLVRKGYGLTAGLLSRAGQTIAEPSAAGDLRTLSAGFSGLVGVVLPVAAALVAVGVVANLAQTRLAVSPSLLKPKLSRISPKAGLKRLVSPTSLWSTAKTLLRLGVLVLIGWRAVDSVLGPVLSGGDLGLFPEAAVVANAAVRAAQEMAAVSLAVALVDYGVHHRRISRALKMTRHEVKEDLKQNEGNPVIRGAVRRKQRAMSRQRMIAAVAGADTVVVNPTHVAVALKYEAGRGAPRVVAKGADEVALRIRLEAEIQGVPVVQDVPLARAIFGACEIDQEIPRELYEAVARLLSFLYGLRAAGRLRRLDGGPLLPPSPLLAAPA